MRQAILDFPKQFCAGIEAAKNIRFRDGVLENIPENIIICGMGGSGMPGEILTTLRPIDVFSYKSYDLPPQAGKNSLVICISFSGNTEETISSFQAARTKKLPMIVITTGGRLKELAKKYSIPCVILPQPSLPPRLALGQMFGALLQVLQNYYLLDKNLINELIEVGDGLKPEKLEKQGRILAKKIFKKIPIIYTSRRFREIGSIWKNSLNETAKIIAFANYFPELNHNEIVGFEEINTDQISNKKVAVFILRDLDDSHHRILKQMDITKAIIEKEGIKVEFIDMPGKNMLEKIFTSTLLGFWTSFFLAMEYRVDPTEIKTIEEFKRRLAKGK